uniref:Major facilitator superfamily (MFS) profile domain-containing protein n=1 Tax=Timema shepardi TaxID=629360 RepID=A0A7R9B792_TIMSH|nr:unnamed protein product [Timema shepardi]
MKNIWSQTAPLFQRQHILMTLLVCALQFGYYTCFNSLLLWLPEMFNNMAAYSLFYDGQTASVCESMRAFVVSTVDETLYQYLPGNRSIWNYESNPFTSNSSLIDDIILSGSSYGNQTEIAECDSTITPETFRNTLIIGGGTGAINLIIGFVVRWTGRKVIGFVFMGVAAGSCIGLNFGQTSEIVLVLAFLFVCLTGVSSSLLNSAVVDIFPTQLRGMAVCLTFMSGRAGVIIGSIMIGALVDTNCSVAFYVLAALALGGFDAAMFLGFYAPYLVLTGPTLTRSRGVF